MARRTSRVSDQAFVGLIAVLALLVSAITASAVADSYTQHLRDCPQPSCAESRTTQNEDGRAAGGSEASGLAAIDGLQADTPACCAAVTGSESSSASAEDGEGAGDAMSGRAQQQLQLQAVDSAGSVATASEAVAAAFGEGDAATGAQEGAAAASSGSSATAAGLVAGPGAGAGSAAALGAATTGAFGTATRAAFGTLAAAGEGETNAFPSPSSSSDSDLPSSATTSVPTHIGADGSGESARRALVAVYPSSVTNGSASATFPSAAFGAWCGADAACAAAGSLNLTLLHYTDAASVAAITAAVLNWPAPLSAAAGSGVSVSSQTLVSGVVELQLDAYPAKKDMPICSTASGSGSCAAQLSIPLTSGAVDVTKSTACIRLEPTILGTGFQAVGYPTNGTDGTAVVGIITNNQLKCNTTKFGKHVIMQYRQTAAVPPSPPASSPPPPPAPPPPLNATGAVLTSEVELKVKLVVGVSFNDLKASNDTLTQLKSSLEGSLASSLDSQVPALLLLSRGLASANSGTISRISRYAGATETAVTVEFVIRVPAGATEAQITALMTLLTSNTTAIFAGSAYTSKFMGPAAVTRVVAEDAAGISVAGAVGIALGCLAAFVLLLGGAYGLYRYRAYQALLPKRPDGDWDEYGVAVVQPRNKQDNSRAARRERRAKPSAVVPMESEAAAVVPPPWAGANAPTTVEPAAAAAAAGAGAGAQPQALAPGGVVGAGPAGGPGAAGAAGGIVGGGGGGAAMGGAGGRLSEGGGGPQGGGGPKSEADLRAVWG